MVMNAQLSWSSQTRGLQEPYWYGRALTIRLLHLEPGNEDEVLQCVLRESSLDQSALFNALSYAWETLQPFSRSAVMTNR
jgi:hypothetical protein